MGNERRVNVADRSPVYAVKERMSFDLLNVETRLGVGQESGVRSVRQMDSPADEIFRLATEMHVVREVEVVLPVDNLAIHIMRVFRAERRVAYCQQRLASNPPTRHSNMMAPRDHQSHSLP